MKPDFEKIARKILDSMSNSQELYWDIFHLFEDFYEDAYLEGRKAQVKVDAEIARGTVDMTMHSGEIISCHVFGDGGIEAAKAIESQEIK